MILPCNQENTGQKSCHRQFKAVVDAVDDCRKAVEERKIIAKESLNEIDEWKNGINAKFIEADNDVKRMEDGLKAANRIKK